ncbi:MAG TPA: PilZ domain-containing protein [Pirellulales bacterium]
MTLGQQQINPASPPNTPVFNSATDLDPQLLEDIVAHLEKAGAQRQDERRKSYRQRFPVTQLIAPFYKRMPSRDQFTAVECHDISTGGIAFYWPEAPTFRKAIFGLGERERLTCVAVQVVRHLPRPEEPGQFLVGCEFVERVAMR